MRPTALIRRVLQLDYLQEDLSRQMRAVKQDLQSQDITIIEVEHRAMDVRVQYKVNGYHHEALFMMPMLHAEVNGLFRRWLGEKRQ
ncbi:MAG TPA: hypothetical protein GX517_04795 [Alicyclobacillus sp.]|nr:hypothetical protein [Alicyclobacillus sp.]